MFSRIRVIAAALTIAAALLPQPGSQAKSILDDFINPAQFSAKMPADYLMRTLTHDNKKRTYYVHVPPHPGKGPMPVIVLLHGAASTAGMIVRDSNMPKYSDKLGYLVVVPQALAGRWCDGRPFDDLPPDDDAGFVDEMLKKLQKDYVIDPKRVYLAGMSNGGFFAQYMDGLYPGRFAAVVSVVANSSTQLFAKAKAPYPVPIMFILGEADPVIPFTGGTGAGSMAFGGEGFSESADKAVKHWVKMNNCDPKPVVTKLKSVVNDGTSVTCFSYKPKTGNCDVVEYVIKGGGHTWPGGTQYMPEDFIGKCSKQLNASQVMLDFFNQHHR